MSESPVPLLEIRDLSISFGGLAAVDDVSLAVEEGKVQAVIGPNGAGKTTLLNLIAGVYRPNAGTVHLRGQDITSLPQHRVAECGIARTFQSPQVFPHMVALENVLVGAHLHAERRLLHSVMKLGAYRRQEASLREHALELMAFLQIADWADAESTTLPFGVLKRLELARALAQKPTILLLDEPAAGLNMAETEAIGRTIKELPNRGVTPILVEHDMKLVMSISDDVHVLDQGQTIAEGPPAAIQNDPLVIEAYLGANVDVGEPEPQQMTVHADAART